jgi:hypothetical protein
MDIVSKKIAALPTKQAVFVAIAGSLMILSALYLFRNGSVIPLALVGILAFLIYITIVRMKPAVESRPPTTSDTATAYTVFRSMEPADQTRVNAWTGILQEDVYANRTGPIGTFVGNDDVTPNAPLYPITSG